MQRFPGLPVWFVEDFELDPTLAGIVLGLDVINFFYESRGDERLVDA